MNLCILEHLLHLPKPKQKLSYTLNYVMQPFFPECNYDLKQQKPKIKND